MGTFQIVKYYIIFNITLAPNRRKFNICGLCDVIFRVEMAPMFSVAACILKLCAWWSSIVSVTLLSLYPRYLLNRRWLGPKACLDILEKKFVVPDGVRATVPRIIVSLCAYTDRAVEAEFSSSGCTINIYSYFVRRERSCHKNMSTVIEPWNIILQWSSFGQKRCKKFWYTCVGIGDVGHIASP